MGGSRHLGAALEGVERVYITHPDVTHPGATEQVDAFSRSAVASGVRRLVLLSGRGDATVQALEEGVTSSGADWTVIQPGWFNQNFNEGFFLEAVLAGEFALPAGAVGEVFVDADDIADVVVAALSDDQHTGRTYELSGPRLLSFSDVAAELSKATGREITYIPLTQERFRAVLRESGLPEEFADGFAESLDGRNAHLVHGVEEALGRKPKDFSEFARENSGHRRLERLTALTGRSGRPSPASTARHLAGRCGPRPPAGATRRPLFQQVALVTGRGPPTLGGRGADTEVPDGASSHFLDKRDRCEGSPAIPLNVAPRHSAVCHAASRISRLEGRWKSHERSGTHFGWDGRRRRGRRRDGPLLAGGGIRCAAPSWPPAAERHGAAAMKHTKSAAWT